MKIPSIDESTLGNSMVEAIVDRTTPVLVALSGGVDSAVALRLILNQYANVTGVSHRHWPDSKCCSTECIDNCRAQCLDAGVPYHTVDTMVEFCREIVDPFVESYRTGTTPNPCVQCNRKNRFGHMIEKFYSSQGIPIPKDYCIATGHYARILWEKDRPTLHRGLDPEKDQSYMLYRLSTEQLSHCLFPLGEMKKSEVRRLAIGWKLSSAKSGDSQDVCFVEKDYREFLKDYSGIQESPGEFLDEQGTKLGTHRGAPYYTRGQRKGLGLSGGPWYVVKVDATRNEVVLGKKEELAITRFEVWDCVWNLPEIPMEINCEIQVRYHGEVTKGRVQQQEKSFVVELEDPSFTVTPGQSAVFYQSDRVLGGGIIQNVL